MDAGTGIEPGQRHKTFFRHGVRKLLAHRAVHHTVHMVNAVKHEWKRQHIRCRNNLAHRPHIKIAKLQRSITYLLDRVRQPFNVNRLAQLAAATAIRCRDRVAERRQQNLGRMKRLGDGMRELGVEVAPSQTNFYLAVVDESVTDLFERLLRQGVIVRPMGPFGMPPGSFRVNTGTDEENEFYLAALGRVLRGEDLR